MYIAAIKIYPPTGREQSVIDVLETLRGPVARNADCLGCSLAIEPGEGGAICYTERWRDRAALDRHLQSPLYSRVLEAMECSRQAPGVEFYEVSDSGGLEMVELARNKQ